MQVKKLTRQLLMQHFPSSVSWKLIFLMQRNNLPQKFATSFPTHSAVYIAWTTSLRLIEGKTQSGTKIRTSKRIQSLLYNYLLAEILGTLPPHTHPRMVVHRCTYMFVYMWLAHNEFIWYCSESQVSVEYFSHFDLKKKPICKCFSLMKHIFPPVIFLHVQLILEKE